MDGAEEEDGNLSHSLYSLLLCGFDFGLVHMTKKFV
jgi:hypothetical protein